MLLCVVNVLWFARVSKTRYKYKFKLQTITNNIMTRYWSKTYVIQKVQHSLLFGAGRRMKIVWKQIAQFSLLFGAGRRMKIVWKNWRAFCLESMRPADVFICLSSVGEPTKRRAEHRINKYIDMVIKCWRATKATSRTPDKQVYIYIYIDRYVYQVLASHRSDEPNTG